MKMRLMSSISSLVLGVVVTSVWLSGNLRADDVPQPNRATQASAVRPSVTLLSSGAVTATPEMWFYQQALQRYDDPKTAIRAAAEQKAAQRRARMAAMEWYGYSNSRPLWSIDPVHGPLSPQWVGNGYNSFNWVAPSYPAVIYTVPVMLTGY